MQIDSAGGDACGAVPVDKAVGFDSAVDCKLADGICDCEYNVDACGYDAGDCCKSTCNAQVALWRARASYDPALKAAIEAKFSSDFDPDSFNLCLASNCKADLTVVLCA